MPMFARLFLGLVALGVVAPTARAHAVGLECRIQGAQLEITAFYDDDSPAVRARVRVLDGDREIAAGLTDEKGVWSCACPPPGHYSVKLDAGAGHRAEHTIAVPSSVASPAATAPAIGNGPTRQDFTRFPWERLLLGLLAILALAAAFLLVAAFRKGHANGAR